MAFYNRAYLQEYEAVAVFSQRSYGTFGNGQLFVGDDFGAVHYINISQTFAAGAGALWRIEGKIMRRGVVVGNSGCRIHKFLAVVCGAVGFDIEYHHFLVALGKSLANRFQKPVAVLGGGHYAVDHQFDRMVLVAVELHATGYFQKLAIDSNTQEAFARKLFE